MFSARSTIVSSSPSVAIILLQIFNLSSNIETIPNPQPEKEKKIILTTWFIRYYIPQLFLIPFQKTKRSSLPSLYLSLAWHFSPRSRILFVKFHQPFYHTHSHSMRLLCLSLYITVLLSIFLFSLSLSLFFPLPLSPQFPHTVSFSPHIT